MLLTSKVGPESRVLSLVGLVVDDDQQVAAGSRKGRDEAQEAQEQAQRERSHCRCVCCVYMLRGQLHAAVGPGHTCISWSYVVACRPAKPSHWERGGGETERASESKSASTERAHQQASISAPSTPPPPAIPRLHLRRASNTTQPTTHTHIPQWPPSPSGPRPASTSTGLRATSPPFSGVWSLAASAL